MKIGYFADGIWAHRAFDRIHADEELELCFVVPRHESPDSVLRKKASQAGIPFWETPDVNDPDFVARVRESEVDINVSMSFDQILKPDIIGVAPLGFINCHAGALPFYRGRNVLNWALINGSDQFGVTVHYVDEGIDTGDIIAQRTAPITQYDDYEALLEKAIRLCSLTLHEALRQLSIGQAKRTPQHLIHPRGFYCSRRGEGDEWFEWKWTSERIYNFVRALSPPGPGARTHLGNEWVAVVQASLIDGAPEYIDRPGTVVGKEPGGVAVKTGDTSILVEQISEVDSEGVAKAPRTPSLPIGSRFGKNVRREVERLTEKVDRLEARIDKLTQ